jgi:hypothetical protein
MAWYACVVLSYFAMFLGVLHCTIGASVLPGADDRLVLGLEILASLCVPRCTLCSACSELSFAFAMWRIFSMHADGHAQSPPPFLSAAASGTFSRLAASGTFSRPAASRTFSRPAASFLRTTVLYAGWPRIPDWAFTNVAHAGPRRIVVPTSPTLCYNLDAYFGIAYKDERHVLLLLCKGHASGVPEAHRRMPRHSYAKAKKHDGASLCKLVARGCHGKRRHKSLGASNKRDIDGARIFTDGRVHRLDDAHTRVEVIVARGRKR